MIISRFVIFKRYPMSSTSKSQQVGILRALIASAPNGGDEVQSRTDLLREGPTQSVGLMVGSANLPSRTGLTTSSTFPARE